MMLKTVLKSSPKYIGHNAYEFNGLLFQPGMGLF